MVKVLISLSVLAAAATAGSVTELPESVTKLIDYSINPCDDFYQYACGAWYKDAVIPPDSHSIDPSFTKIYVQNEAVLKKILSDNKPKLGEFYNSCLDTVTLSSLGLTPLEDSFKAIRSANTTLDLLIVAGELVKNGISAFVDIVSRADDNDSTKNALFAKLHFPFCSTMVKVLIALSVLAAAATAGSVTELPESVTKLIDYSINPCDDFYQYACGAWYKDAVIPPDSHSIDPSFTKIYVQNEAVLKKILSDNKPKLGEFYNSCLDTVTLSSLGLTPLEDSFKAIRSANTTLDLLIVAGELVKNGISAFVDIVSRADDNDSTKNALFGYPASLTLRRTYYTIPSEWEIVEADYKVYIASVLQLAGYTAEKAAAAVPLIIRFEQTLAGLALSELEEKDADVPQYTAFTYSQLDQKYPLLVGSWLKAHGFDIYDQWGGSNDWVGFKDLTYFDKTEELLKNTTLDNLRTIVEYKLIHASSNHLTPEFRTANWNFIGKKIYKEKAEPSREKFCRDDTEDNLGEILGQYFLDEVFSADAAKTADELVKALRSSFSTGIATADWLDNSTRATAQTKLSNFVHFLGGPEKPQLYPTLTFDSKSYLKNRWKVSQVKIDTNLKLNGQSVDRRKFDLYSHHVNAYFSHGKNQIVFPAGILQKPFFDGQFDAAQNFGAIGMIIGHEITHGFDNKGRTFDSHGNLKQWWSNATNDAFTTKAQCISDQYSNFVVKSEVNGTVLGNVSGKITLGENIADNGGLKTSFRAYHEYLREFPSQYTEEAGNKLFYLSFAQAWCSKNTDTYLRATFKSKYPPERFRVTGALQNNAEFARVFQCPTDSNLNPSKKCLLWE
ncbi:hypothetical protein H257_19108 [Aphanomyces astaci]|uniref:Peptidase M13 C-terminal domain-containing protein n=1 Tax=Aphanomyces astaci TaxID=112090 RepID=W4FB62_APHAT|nr:hypothetical protein H257_19108 [Aphanomyces astaci]ETV63958.1 hypothetical protein H257_19108 [Aphanomyces astaci]|eukprot:XP_009846558.1 hypothetical protein H257_19108 [Aphanomyces astaci]